MVRKAAARPPATQAARPENTTTEDSPRAFLGRVRALGWGRVSERVNFRVIASTRTANTEQPRTVTRPMKDGL